ncbi:hypothetical protein Vafri_13785 [Volvox africanus]|uniref:Peptidase M11 gametolysin domain-containing protein n=1 Tax=Volvox africanus TaxID=51714 RepID=A0A8J4BCM2_9CHLO|nr:hypothetical protein Vafri_13785 [Volvox africanus]
MACRGLLLAVLLAGMLLKISNVAAQGQRFNVTVYVRGTVNVFMAHGEPTTNITETQPEPEIIYTLADKQNENGPTTSIRVDFGEQADSLVTGDVVQAPLSLQLSTRQAERLGLLPPGASGTSRRLLSDERYDHVRRMVLESHNTRRSLAQVVDLLRALNTIGGSAGRQQLKVGDAKILANTIAQDLFIINGQPQAISSLTFVFKSTSCGVLPKLNASAVQSYLYERDEGAPVVATIKRYYRSCSYNQLVLNPENNLVFDVDIPCVGNTSLGPYNLRTGKGNKKDMDNELWGLVELAKQYLKENSRALFSRWMSFRRKIIVWPFNWRSRIVEFSGLANMGCSEDLDCITWLSPDVGMDSINVPVAFQELGHNIGLAHSARLTCTWRGCTQEEYGDWSDPMGATNPRDPAKGVVCMTAPQAYKAGWASPIPGGNIRASDLPVGIFRDFSLPAMALNKTNMLRIVTMPAGTVANNSALERALYVSYRVRQSTPGAYDSGLQDDLNNRVWVHEYNETANAIPANYRMPPLSLAVLSDDIVRDPSTKQPSPPIVSGYGVLPRSYSQFLPGRGGVTITLRRKTSQLAVVSVCRATSLNETGFCSDGIDNDCDGLVDVADTDCPQPPAMQPRMPLLAAPIRSPPPAKRPKKGYSGPPPQAKKNRRLSSPQLLPPPPAKKAKQPI